ncbi:hypothetical protein ACRTDL_20150 [Shewanella algae]|uniref:hypothetical protein n=1 Tax=Shewanella algae TaxID=38313 RepID=UPI003D7D42DC
MSRALINNQVINKGSYVVLKIKQFAFSVGSYGWIGTIISAIGFAYIATPDKTRSVIKSYIPADIKSYMLSLFAKEEWILILLFISIVCVIWGGIAPNVSLSMLKRKFKKIDDENTQLKSDRESKVIDSYKLFSTYLYAHFSHLKLSPDERVSLYKLDFDIFTCIGRYSDNEIYRSKPNRPYPKDNGCIAKAWAIGSYQDTDAPCPNEDVEAWITYNVDKYGFSDDELRNIRMKSRSFYGARFRNSQQVSIAVIVFESLNPDGLPFGKIKRLLSDHEEKQLCILIETLESHIPKLEYSNAEGF